MGAPRGLVTLVTLMVLAVSLAPTERAWACSCAEPTLADLLEREPGAAVVRIRRIDADGGSSGVGLVEEVLHGPALPRQLPMALDDGASCLPWVAVGDVAVLAFVPQGDGWRTSECGAMDPMTGLDPPQPDPAAAGPPAMAVAGAFPGATLLALDDRLRILVSRDLTGVGSGMLACGEDLVVPIWRPDGTTWLALLRSEDLVMVDEQPLGDDPEAGTEVVDVACAADGIDVITATWGATRELHLRRDVFGTPVASRLPAGADAAFAGDEILLLTSDAAGAELLLFDTAASASRLVGDWPGVDGHEVSVAPDGGHALLRGWDEAPLLVVVDLASGAEVARSIGWWQPVPEPWLRHDRILLQDEDSGGIGRDSTGLAEYRIVDLDLATTALLAPTPAWRVTAGRGVVVRVDGDGLVVTDADGGHVRSLTTPWAAAVHAAVVIGAVSPAPEPADVALPAVDRAVARDAGVDYALTTVTWLGPVLNVALALLVAVAAVAAGVLAIGRRRGSGTGRRA